MDKCGEDIMDMTVQWDNISKTYEESGTRLHGYVWTK